MNKSKNMLRQVKNRIRLLGKLSDATYRAAKHNKPILTESRSNRALVNVKVGLRS